MERIIEKIPPFSGKAVTRLLVMTMLCNSVLTAGAMIRYSERQADVAASNRIEAFLDAHYDDRRMEERWPNMRIVE
jgi:outer membrane protein assembly factor BamD (BamD/ComL family)